jgi:hypothetical protein
MPSSRRGAGFAPTFPLHTCYPPLIALDHELTRHFATSSTRPFGVRSSDPQPAAGRPSTCRSTPRRVEHPSGCTTVTTSPINCRSWQMWASPMVGIDTVPRACDNDAALPGAEHDDLVVSAAGLCRRSSHLQRTFRVDKACRVWDLYGNLLDLITLGETCQPLPLNSHTSKWALRPP